MCEKQINKIQINEINYIIEDASVDKPSYNTSVFRFIDLPMNYSIENVKKYMFENNFKEDEISDVYPEYVYDQRYPHVKNGITRVKVRCVAEEDLFKHKIEPMSKTIFIDNCKVRILRVGEPKLCTLCKETGHIRKECTYINETCIKCNRKDHLTQFCSKSYANQFIKQINANKDANEDHMHHEYEENEISNPLISQVSTESLKNQNKKNDITEPNEDMKMTLSGIISEINEKSDKKRDRELNNPSNENSPQEKNAKKINQTPITHQ